jgi:DHA1 family bicyclomycin/chloramphenicol resistance-like MFS transporter
MSEMFVERERNGIPTRLIVVLGLLAVLGPLTIDLYLPAFPQMQSELATPASQIQLTLTAATIGFAIGQLIIGPWSDSIGRRRPLLIASAVHVVASIAIVAAPDITWVLLLRVLQGAGAAGGGVVAMAMIRDVAEGRNLLRGLARVAVFTGIAPVFAPFIGAQLMSVMSWRGTFAVVAVYGVVMVATCAIWLPETLANDRRFDRFDRSAVWRDYRDLLGNRRFVGIALIGGMMVSAVFAFMSSSSFLFQREYGLTPQDYGLISAANALSFVAGTQISAFLAQRFSPVRVLTLVLPLMAGTGFFLSIVSTWSIGLPPVVITMLAFFALAGGCGPSLGAIGLADQAARAGTAAAFLGAANFGIAGIASPIVGALGLTDLVPLGLVIGTAMSIATVVLSTLVIRNGGPGTHVQTETQATSDPALDTGPTTPDKNGGDMREYLFNDDWTVRRKVGGFLDLLGGAVPAAITLPHDAMREHHHPLSVARRSW